MLDFILNGFLLYRSKIPSSFEVNIELLGTRKDCKQSRRSFKKCIGL